MDVVMSGQVEAYLGSMLSAHADLKDLLEEMKTLYEKRLWHELTLKLEEAVALPKFQTGDLLVNLYHNFITDFEHRISPLKLGHIAVAVSSRYADRLAAAQFMDDVITKIADQKQRGHEEPILYLKMHVALLKVHEGAAADARKMIEEGKAALDALPSVDPSVSAAFHYVNAKYHKSKQHFSEFYRTGMLYLAYVSSDTLQAETRRDLAVDLSLAALLGDDSYDFAELIAHPIMTAIDDTAFAWLKSLVTAFNSGDMAAYDALCVKHAASLNAQPALVANERKLREKITILCLLQILFELPAECREISIADIAARTKLGVDGVEYLLMKALSVRLIEGVIDQVEGKVNVTWVTPRVLLKPQIKELSVRLDGWIEKVKSVGESLQEEIPTLATMA